MTVRPHRLPALLAAPAVAAVLLSCGDSAGPGELEACRAGGAAVRVRGFPEPVVTWEPACLAGGLVVLDTADRADPVRWYLHGAPGAGEPRTPRRLNVVRPGLRYGAEPPRTQTVTAPQPLRRGVHYVVAVFRVEGVDEGGTTHRLTVGSADYAP